MTRENSWANAIFSKDIGSQCKVYNLDIADDTWQLNDSRITDDLSKQIIEQKELDNDTSEMNNKIVSCYLSGVSTYLKAAISWFQQFIDPKGTHNYPQDKMEALLVTTTIEDLTGFLINQSSDFKKDPKVTEAMQTYLSSLSYLKQLG